MKVDFRVVLGIHIYIYIYKLCENNISQLLVITLFKGFLCRVLIIDI